MKDGYTTCVVYVGDDTPIHVTYIHMYIRTYVHTYICTYTYTCTHTHVHVHANLYEWMKVDFVSLITVSVNRRCLNLLMML